MPKLTGYGMPFKGGKPKPDKTEKKFPDTKFPPKPMKPGAKKPPKK